MADGITQFLIDIDKFTEEEIPRQILQVTRAISLRLLSGVVLKTPVDTGRARGNWLVSIGSPNNATSDRLDKGGNTAIAEGSGTIAGLPEPLVVYVQNNLPYIGVLEGGSSKQAPAGMVAVTISEISAGFK